MIQAHLIANGSDYVELYWNHPKFLPESYKLKYMCALNDPCISSSEDAENSYLMSNIRNLSSDTTSVRISDLRPSSFCTLVLLAVYNPASIDSGIVITGTTGTCTFHKHIRHSKLIPVFRPVYHWTGMQVGVISQYSMI